METSGFLTSSINATDYLQSCFFVYDDYHKDEMARDEELILFFHPQNVDISKRLQLMGACDSMITFTTTFTKSPIRVIEMKKMKLTYRVIDKFTVVLTAGPDCSRHSLESMLDILLQAFRFYHHSFAELHRISEGKRKIFQDNAARACSLLLPMVSRFHTSLADMFHPMPYLELSKIQPRVGSNTVTRFFIQASRILTQVEMTEHTMACCLVHSEGSVLCTHLDIDTTRFIVNRIATLEPQGGPGPESFSEDCYVDSETIAKLRADRTQSAAGIHIALSPDRNKSKSSSRLATPSASPAPSGSSASQSPLSSSSSSSTASSAASTPSSNKHSQPLPLGTPSLPKSTSSMQTPTSTPKKGPAERASSPQATGQQPAPRIYEKMALIIVRVGNLFLATLADSAALTGANDYVGRLNKMLVGPVGSLDSAITKAVLESSVDATASSPSAAVPIPLSGALLHSGIAQTGTGSSVLLSTLASPSSPSPNQPTRLNSSSASSSPSPSVLSRSGGSGSPRTVFTTRISSPRADMHAPVTPSRSNIPVPYNYLTFNHPTQTQSGAIAIRKPAESEKNFLRIVSHAHDVFYENPQVSKLIMKDGSSNIFCRNLFGRETFYQQPSTVAFKNIEDSARDSLSSGDDGLTLI